LKPVLAFLQKQGIPVSVYIDDGLFGARDSDTWNAVRVTIWDTISKAGWTIEQDKSDGINMGSMSKHYLGFGINTRLMKIFLPQDKVSEITDQIFHFLISNTHPAKKLAKILGKIVSCIPSHGPYARICSRSGYMDLQKAVDAWGWAPQVTLSESTRH